MANVKEHATLSAGASVDHGVEVEATEDHVNRAADRGCCVSTCCASSFLDEGPGVPSGLQIREALRAILSSSEDVENVMSYCIRLRNQAMRTSLNDGNGCWAIKSLEKPEGVIPTQTPILDANPN